MNLLYSLEHVFIAFGNAVDLLFGDENIMIVVIHLNITPQTI